MKFTLVFPSSEATDLSVGLVFAPCAIWMISNKIFLNPHSTNPHYLPGDFQELLIRLEKRFELDIEKMKGKRVFVVVHDIGHGSKKYLKLLTHDISMTGLIPVIIE